MDLGLTDHSNGSVKQEWNANRGSFYTGEPEGRTQPTNEHNAWTASRVQPRTASISEDGFREIRNSIEVMRNVFPDVFSNQIIDQLYIKLFRKFRQSSASSNGFGAKPSRYQLIPSDMTEMHYSQVFAPPPSPYEENGTMGGRNGVKLEERPKRTYKKRERAGKK
jgi:hypothetical protein